MKNNRQILIIAIFFAHRSVICDTSAHYKEHHNLIRDGIDSISRIFTPRHEQEPSLDDMLLSECQFDPGLGDSYINHNHVSSGKKDEIPVAISIHKSEQLRGKFYIVTGNKITFNADVLDKKFLNTELIYNWKTKNDTQLGSSNSSELIHVFDKPDEDTYIEVDVKTNHTTSNTTVTGIDSKPLVIRDPINWIKTEYNQGIYYGDLFSAKFQFNGTKPYCYCYRLKLNATGMIKFRHCDIITSDFVYVQPIFLNHVGEYLLDFKITNIASQVTKEFVIKVRETAREQGVNYVPIISCILAVLILLSGVALHYKFKRHVNMETAEFDFTRNAFEDEEWDEVQTFGERIRYLLFGLNRNEQKGLLNPDLNRSRTRLIQ